MITVHIPKKEVWDDQHKEFIYVNEQTVTLEHSLISITKWETKHHKVFLDDTAKKTEDEIIDYIRCMCITPLKDEKDVYGISAKDIKRIMDYMADPMIPFNFKKDNINGKRRGGDPLCGVMIYYYMTAAQIPFECQKWHINQLLALIRIYGIKNNPGKPLKGSALASRNTALNQERKARLGTKG